MVVMYFHIFSSSFDLPIMRFFQIVLVGVLIFVCYSEHYVAFYEDSLCRKGISYYKFHEGCRSYSDTSYLKFTCSFLTADVRISRSSQCIDGDLAFSYCKFYHSKSLVNNQRCNPSPEGTFYKVFCSQATEPFPAKVIGKFSSSLCIEPHQYQGIVPNVCLNVGPNSMKAECVQKNLILKGFRGKGCLETMYQVDVQPICHRNFIFGNSKVLNC